VNKERRNAGAMRLPRGLVFSELAGHAGKERGPGLITPRPSPLLASVVVGARSLLALLLFSASS
jgi:hypothetical protein